MSDINTTWIEPGEFIDPVDVPTLEAAGYDVVATDSQLIELGSTQDASLARQNADYVAPDDRDITRNLHSRMRNYFFITLLKAVMRERYFLHDRAYILQSMYDLEPTGSQEDFLLKYGNIMVLMNAQFPTYFNRFIGSDNPNFLLTTAEQQNINLDLQNRFLRRLIRSEYLVRRYAGSRYAYLANFARMEQPGTIYLRMRYDAVPLGDQLYGKFYRAKMDADRKQILPGGSKKWTSTGDQIDVWPDVPSYLDAKKNYTAEFDPHVWDTRRDWDSGYIQVGTPGSPGNVIEWDEQLSTSPGGKGLILEFTLDRLHYHLNSFNETYCLLDEPWYTAMDDLLRSSGRVGDSVMLGSQLSLVANNDGTVSKYSTDDPYGDHRDTYTHPNIKARVQILSEAWNLDSSIGRIIIGSGGPNIMDTEIDDLDLDVEGPARYYNAFWIKESEIGTQIEADKKEEFRIRAGLYPTFTLTLTSGASPEPGGLFNITVPGGITRGTLLSSENTAILVAAAIVEAQSTNFIVDGWNISHVIGSPTITFIRRTSGPETGDLIVDEGVTGVTYDPVVKTDGLASSLPEKPVFSTYVGMKETKIVQQYIFGDIMCHPIQVQGETLNGWFSIPPAGSGGTQIPNPDTDPPTAWPPQDPPDPYLDTITTPIIIRLPHTNIAPGTCTFELRFTVDHPPEQTGDTDSDTVVIKVTERYNPYMRDFNTITTVWKEIDDILYPLDSLRLVKYMTDSTFYEETLDYDESGKVTVEELYFPGVEDSIIELARRDESTTTPALGRLFSMCEIDYISGELRIFTELNRDGRLGSYTASLEDISFAMKCTYSINALGTAISLVQAEGSSSLKVKISEIGIYNSSERLVAYGTFPPIIYDPNSRHIAFNIALELPSIL